LPLLPLLPELPPLPSSLPELEQPSASTSAKPKYADRMIRFLLRPREAREREGAFSNAHAARVRLRFRCVHAHGWRARPDHGGLGPASVIDLRGLNDTAPAADRRYHELLRARTPAERLEHAVRLTTTARALAEAGIRHRQPELDERQVRAELARRMYGDAVARRLFGADPLP
jgi:hypothetical protein